MYSKLIACVVTDNELIFYSECAMTKLCWSSLEVAVLGKTPRPHLQQWLNGNGKKKFCRIGSKQIQAVILKQL